MLNRGSQWNRWDPHIHTPGTMLMVESIWASGCLNLASGTGEVGPDPDGLSQSINVISRHKIPDQRTCIGAVVVNVEPDMPSVDNPVMGTYIPN